MHWLARVAAALVVLVAGAAYGNGPEAGGWLGQRVFLNPGAVLKVGKTVVDDPEQQARTSGGRRALLRGYRVDRQRGPWLWLVPERDGVPGWAKAAQVVLQDRAVPYFTQVIRAHPRDLLAYLRRGILRRDQRDYASAVADFDEAIRLDPKSAVAHNHRGRTRQSAGDLDGAIHDYDTALRLDPEDAVAFSNRGHIWQLKGDLDQAIADYDAVSRLHPKDATVYYNRGHAWQAKGELDHAIADFDEALRLDPGNVQALFNRGLVWQSKGELDHAIADFDEAIRLDPKDASAYSNRGHVRKLKAEFDLALADYDAAIGIDPQDPAPYNNRAWIRATCPDPRYRNGSLAVASATRACELTGWKNADDVDTLAAACAEAGDFVAAVKWQETALGLYTDEAARKEGRAHLELYLANKPYREELTGK
jgi:tetratricopeptide (TPR) repeat protein